MKKYSLQILEEISQVLPQLEDKDSKKFCAELKRAKRVYITGVGRSGLVVKAFGQRLMHIGMEVHLADEITAPGASRGDLLVACSGTGSTLFPLYMARKAKKIGARVVALTGKRTSSLARLANQVIFIPAPLERGKKTKQPARSLFEQVLFLYLDGVTLQLMQEMSVPFRRIERRHANLE